MVKEALLLLVFFENWLYLKIIMNLLKFQVLS